MPVFEDALYDYLISDPTLNDLVNGRIYPQRLPEGVLLPAISWQRISAERTYTYDPFDETDAYVSARIQFNCWAGVPEEAMTVGDAILGALSGYGGPMAGELIGSSFAVNEIDDFEAATKFYRRIVDFMISYEEDVATGVDAVASPESVGGTGGT
jgi:hypothetical protein